jgi:MFS family permease
MRLWAAQIGSAFGSRITRTVLPMIAILTVGATTTQIGIFSVLGVTPGLFLAVFAGGIIDRGSKRKILIVADLVRAFAILAVPVLAWMGRLGILELYIMISVVGMATAIFSIADNSYLPSLVPQAHLVDANSKLEATDSIAETAGPGIAGILVDLITAPLAMVIDALTYFWSAFMLFKIDAPIEPPTPKPHGQGLFADAVAGFRICMGDPTIKVLLIVSALGNFFGGMFVTLYMVLGLTMLNLSPAVLGLVISVGGIGAFIGASVASRISNWLGLRAALFWMFIAGQISMLFVPASLINPDWGVWFLIVAQLFEDGFLTVFFILALSLRQQIVPDEYLGRANATFHVFSHLLFPVGALIAGPLTIVVGFEITLWLMALGGFLSVPLLFPLRAKTG